MCSSHHHHISVHCSRLQAAATEIEANNWLYISSDLGITNFSRGWAESKKTTRSFQKLLGPPKCFYSGLQWGPMTFLGPRCGIAPAAAEASEGAASTHHGLMNK
jgi:hypothetical protein